MNTFRKDDMIKVASNPHLGPVRVKYTNGPYVYYEHPTYQGANAHYNNCTLVSAKPKFGPGDVVSNGGYSHKDTIKCVKTHYHDGIEYTGPVAYDYVSDGFDYERSLTLVRRAESITDLINAGKFIEAIKQHRIIHGTGLKEAKEAVEALRDNGHTLGDILGAALKPKPKFKVGDRLTHPFGSVPFYTIKDIRPSDGHILYAEFPGAGYCAPSNEYSIYVAPVSAIVVRVGKNGKYEPNGNPHIHGSEASAKSEAERLALKHPGVSFAVLLQASTSTATAPVAGVVTTVTA